MNKIKRLFYRIFVCPFLGHTHPWFSCMYCGKKSSLGFMRDEYGVAITDSRGASIIIKK